MRRAAAILTTSALLLGVVLLAGCAPEAEYDGDFRYGSGVPESEREPIEAGVAAMKEWLAAEGDVHLKRLRIEVEDDINTLVARFAYYNEVDDPLLVAQWLVSGGALASGNVIYIYAGPEWHDYTDWQKSLVAAHEVFHVAQYGFLFDDWFLNEQEAASFPPTWLIEGGADYAAARALDAAGIYAFEDSLAQATERSKSYPGSLSDISSPDGDLASGDAAPYAVGLLATAELAGRSGEAAMFDFWDALPEVPHWEAAFERAYGVTADAFVVDFDEAREGTQSLLTGGVAGRLAREDGSAVTGAYVTACSVTDFFCRGTWTSDSGEFVLGLEPGEYDVRYRVATRDSVEQGFLEMDGVPAESLSVTEAIVDGLTATVRKPL